ncbi:MAG: hypothetical protein CMF70_00490 [Magnetovibrio sp.]|nr:hypothetical protein [Magnetovibrio sp.]
MSRILIAIFVLIFAPFSAFAHAFGSRYDLPLPLELFMLGAGATVLVSFVIMSSTLKHGGEKAESLKFDMLKLSGLGFLGKPIILNTIRIISVGCFCFLLVSVFFGSPDPFENIAPTFVWVIWWVGMAFLSALIGNLWDLINPWKILFSWFEEIAGGPWKILNYPSWLDYWPSVFLFYIFAWLELIAEGSEVPENLAILLVIYSGITWIGQLLFGREKWLKHGEIFTVFFGLFARFAPTIGGLGQWNLRLPGIGLLCEKPFSISRIFFIVILLATVTFDGILETPLWVNVLEWFSENRSIRLPLIMLQDAGFNIVTLIKTLFLVILPFLFLLVFFVFCHATAMFGSGGRIPSMDVAGYFILSLIPIAIAYHLAHYFSYLLIAGQYIIPLVSDPLGLGWNLFGTIEYRIDIGIVNAKFVWYLAVVAIVFGHAMAVYVAHFMAIRVFFDRKSALRSQFPMLVLMVLYTMISLWILSQPIIS